MILEVLMRFINQHITPQNIAASEVLENTAIVAKHLVADSRLLPRSLLFDARGSVSDFNAVPLLNSSRSKNVYLI